MALFLKNFKKSLMDSFVLAAASNTQHYYIVLSRHTPWPDENSPPAESESVEDSFLTIEREMMLGKKITAADVSFLIDKKDWSTNTAYAMYDHRDDDLFDKDFYVVNTTNSVFKCLFNNQNSVSTSEPTTLSTEPFVTADGYIWKYMYTLGTSNAQKFAITGFSQVDANATVEAAAVNGAIHVIQVENGGAGYKTSNGTVQQVVNSTVFKVETTNNPAENDYYNTSGFYIENGTGVGNLVVIEDYISNASGRFVKTSSSLSLDTTSEYLISPRVLITGDGSGTTAYSTANATTGAITAINVLNIGQDYSFANATIVANTAYGSDANVTAIISPPGGHGAKTAQELGAERVVISVNISNTESNTIPTEIVTRQAGLLANPVQYGTNTTLYTANTFRQTTEFTYTVATGSFTNNEYVIGQTSSANAKICFVNSSVMYLTSEIGTFANGENIVGQTSGTTGVITSINNPDLERYTGEIYYYDNIQPVQRSNTSIELVRLVVLF